MLFLHPIFVASVTQFDAEMDVEVTQQEFEREALAGPEELFLPPLSKKSAPKKGFIISYERSRFGELVEIDNSTALYDVPGSQFLSLFSLVCAHRLYFYQFRFKRSTRSKE